MAKTTADSGANAANQDQDHLTFHAHGADKIELPSAAFIADANMTRDGDDLVLTTPQGDVAVIEGYFSAEPAPLLQSADGMSVLTPNLVDSFARSPSEFAANGTANDESPVGAVEEVKGNATVTRADGTVETITIGTPIYQGDIIETDAKGAVNITFIDETTMAVSENARLAVDQYTFDPATESGTTNFSVLRGLFVFTSGLIGRDDPDDVKIDTPVGSIGIRGTIIAGEINPAGTSKVTVLEGAIVVTNGNMETTLSQQFETVRLGGFDKPMESMGVVPANDIATRFSSVSAVSPTLFTTINDSAHEQPTQEPSRTQQPAPDAPSSSEPQSPQQTAPEPVTLNNTTPNMASMPTTAAVTTIAAPPAAIDSGIANLNGSSTGLPSSAALAGQTSASTTNSSLNSAPILPAVNAPLASNLAPSPATTAPVATQPPPSIINTGTTPNGGTAAPSAPSLQFVAGTAPINDIMSAGTKIGAIGVQNGTGYAYTFENGSTISTNGYYTLVASGAIANLYLTASGAQHLGSSFNTLQLEDVKVIATDTTSGGTLAGNYTITVVNANAGNTIGLDTAANNVVIGDSISNGIGSTITALGDVNNDGFADFAFSNNAGLAGQNHSYIIYGFNGYLPTNDINLPAGRVETRVNPTSAVNFSDSIITGIGDFNGDGVEDYAIGQSHNNFGAIANAGTAAIVSGGSAASFRTFTTGLSGVGAGSEFGASITGIGDFNNDGYADVVVGAPGAGRVYLVQGGAATWGASLNGNTTSITDAAASGASGNSTFASSLIGLGDINGDGYADFAANAPGYNSNSGIITVFKGNQTGSLNERYTISGTLSEGLGTDLAALGDINGDGRSDFMASNAAGKGYIYLGAASGNTSGLNIDLSGVTGTTIIGTGGVGDFNGDGYDDFVISTQSSTESHNFVVFGKDFTTPSFTINAAYLKNSANALELTRNEVLAGAGGSVEVSGVGDINGDGYDDFAIGSSDINGGGTAGTGGMFLIYGRASAGTAAPNVHVGGTGNDNLDDGGANGAVLRGGAGNDLFRLNSTNFLQIDGGTNSAAGKDTIVMGQSLNFSGVNFEHMSGIEGIQYGGDAQTMTLTIENLFNLLKTSDDGTLTIKSGGNSGLLLNLMDNNTGIDNYTSGTAGTTQFLNDAAGGSTAVSHNTSTAGYDTFVIGGYKLLIDTAVTVDAQ